MNERHTGVLSVNWRDTEETEWSFYPYFNSWWSVSTVLNLLYEHCLKCMRDSTLFTNWSIHIFLFGNIHETYFSGPTSSRSLSPGTHLDPLVPSSHVLHHELVDRLYNVQFLRFPSLLPLPYGPSSWSYTFPGLRPLFNV